MCVWLQQQSPAQLGHILWTSPVAHRWSGCSYRQFAQQQQAIIPSCPLDHSPCCTIKEANQTICSPSCPYRDHRFLSPDSSLSREQ
ncbi:hypothetical protein GN956_G6506 [Arapaima gigas]